MILARVFTKIYKENGIILIDSSGQKYICGKPRKENLFLTFFVSIKML